MNRTILTCIIGIFLFLSSINVQGQKKKNVFIEDAPASFVAPQKVKLERFVLDEIPTNWKVEKGGTLQLTKEIYRAGKAAIKWNCEAGSKLELDYSADLKRLLIPQYVKVAFGGGIGFQIWIYNPEIKPNRKLNISLAGNDYHKEVDFALNYTGWRTCYIQFAEMSDGGSAPDGKIVITAPKGLKDTWFVLDRFELGRLPSHSMADHQLPYSKNDNHWVNQYWWEMAGKPAVTKSPSNEEIRQFDRMIENIKTKSLGWSLHVDAWISDAERKLITSGSKSEAAKAVAERIRGLATEKYNELELEKNKPNISTPISSKAAYPNEITWRDIEEFAFPMAALDYHYFQDEAAANRVLNLLDWFEAQGIVAGHSYGSQSHVGYRSRNLAVGLLLCQELLEKTDRKDKWIETLKWVSGFAECYTKKDRNGGVGDDGTVAMARLLCVLMQDDTPEKMRDAKCYFQWFDDVLGVSDGTQGVIKADYSFYHHAMMLAGYWLTNIPQFVKVLMAFEGTEYANSPAWTNVRQNLLVFNRMYRSQTQPFNLRGRHFDDREDYRIHDITLELAMHGNPATGEKIDSDLASTWLRRRKEGTPIPAEFKQYKSYDTYHQVLNWAGVSTHSTPQATVTVMGVNNNTLNWDPGEARVYSRYNRCGSMYIHSGTKSAEDNGYIDKGWDWSRLPGVTAVYLKPEELKKATQNSGGYGDERSFTGGTELNNNGVYGYRISEGKSKDWNGNKSYFFFGDRIICLGSELSAADNAPLQTTLFQLNLESSSSEIGINEQSISDFPFSKKLENQALNIVDLQGHGYYLPENNNAVEIQKQSQTTGDSFGKINTGNFAVAFINHGIKPKNASYEYMIQLNGAVEKTEYTVLKKDSLAHVVRDERSGMVSYVVFKATDNLPGPVAACSRPGLIMVQNNKNKVELSFCDPDLMTNPGGEITRYNLGDAPASPQREVKIRLNKRLTKTKGSGISTRELDKTILEFSTANAIVEKFELE